ncbi:Forkhead box protein K1 [Cichlidogyrus casuarinus]|uniref:Forkhead box protein K1 n=1 Tax=Cichlidogyrus casuarinus TaxID=1844966 RepID=A0ABD2Q291_9PLAT
MTSDTIICITCPDDSKKFFNKNKIVLGRRSHQHIDVCLDDSACISRRHLEIHKNACEVSIRVLGKNGVFINNDFFSVSTDLVAVASE